MLVKSSSNKTTTEDIKHRTRNRNHTVSRMKLYLALLITLPLLATALKIKTQTRETYASYAKRNGIPLEKSKAEQQSATCYDYFGQQGQSCRITDYVPYLFSLGWDNKFSSCCFYGTWVMYGDSTYNENNPSVRNIFESLQGAKFYSMYFRLQLTVLGEKTIVKIFEVLHLSTTKLLL